MKRKIFLITVVVLLAALLVAGLVACGGDRTNNYDDSQEEHQHEMEYFDYVPADCANPGNIAYFHCSSCGKYFDEDENEIDESAIVLPATGEHVPSEWIEDRPASCTQKAKHHRDCENCSQKIEEEEYGDLEDHVESSVIVDEEATCTEDGKGHTECVNCHTPMREDIPISKLSHDMTPYGENSATCTEDGNHQYYHCENCQKNFSDYDGEYEMSQEDIVIEALGHKFDNDGKYHTSDEKHWHYCTRCYENVDEEAHTGEESCTVCNWVNNPFKVSKYWENGEQVCKLTEYTGSDANVNVPAQVDGIPLVAIGENVFADRLEIKSVTLPTGVVRIENGAFQNSGITSIVLPEGLKQIGDRALLNCIGLTEITIPESLESLGNAFISDWSSEKPFALKTINWNAIDCYCNISFGVLSHSGDLMPQLTDINIGANVNKMPKVFNETPSQTIKINVPTFKDWCEIDFDWGTYNCLINCNGTLYANGEEVDLENLDIPEGVTKIGDYAFYAQDVQTVTLPASLTSIGIYSFDENENLQSVTFNGTLKQWCEISFNSNPLTENEDMILTIDGKEIEGGELVVPDGTVRIGAYAFYNRNITKLTIPASVTEIGTGAFQYNHINEVHFGGDLKQWCEMDCDYDSSPLKRSDAKSNISLYAKVNGEETEIAGEFTLPAGTTTIHGGAFYGLRSLTKLNLNRDGALTNIGREAFYATGLTSVDIPDSVEQAGFEAFYGCEDLETVSLGSSIKGIGSVFDECNKLKYIEVSEANETYSSQSGVLYVYAQRNNEYNWEIAYVPALVEGEIVIKEGVTNIYNEFQNKTRITSVVLPSSLQTVQYLSYATIKNLERGISFYGCSSLTSFRMAGDEEKNEYFTTYKGVLYNNDGDSTYSLCAIPMAIETVELITGCNTIDRHDFAEWEPNQFGTMMNVINTFDNLTTVILPEMISSVDEYTFSSCDALEQILIGMNNSVGSNPYFKSFDGILYTNLSDVNASPQWDLWSIPQNLKGDVTILEGVTKLNEDSDFVNEGTSRRQFKGRTNVTSITLPQSLTDIPDEDPFDGCLSLKSIAFANGENEKYLTYEGILYKKDGDSLEIMVVPEGIETVIIHEKITRLDSVRISHDFQNHLKLKTVTLHEGIVEINKEEFAGCTALEQFTMSGAGENAFFKTEGGILFKKDGDNLEYYIVPQNLQGELVVKYGDAIAANTFKGTGITSVIIPDNVTEIGESAFEGCSQLETVTIGTGVKTIGKLAFKDCSSLTTVYWNAINCTGTTVNSTYIDEEYVTQGIFYGCDQLSEIRFAADVQSIPNYAFYGVKGLTELTINVPSIGMYAFANCDIATLTIDKDVQSIDVNAFADNQRLATVDFKPVDFKGTANIFANCPLGNVTFDASITTLPAIFCGSPLTEYTVPDQFQTIAAYAFAGCDSLQTINFGNVTIIGANAFAECNNLITVNFGGVQEIGRNAFYGCENLQTLIFGSVTTIGESAFYNCNSLQTLDTGNVTTISGAAFRECAQLTTVTIGKSVESITYNSAPAFYGCESLTTVYWNAIAATVGVLSNNPYGPFQGCDNLSAIIFGEDVQSLPTYALNGLMGLKTLEINVPVIGAYAFKQCALETVTIGEDVQEIDINAFAECNNLTTVYWNAINCTKAGEGGYTSTPGREALYYRTVFYQCQQLSTFEFGDKVENIPAYLLAGYQKADPAMGEIGEITIPESVKSIGDQAFKQSTITKFNFNAINCADGREILINSSRLTSITIGDKVTRIPAGLFQNITYQGTIVIPESVTEIGAKAFDSVTNYDIVLGTSVKTLGEDWFSRSSSGEYTGGKIYYLGEETDLDGITFEKEANKSTTLQNCYFFSAESNTDGKHWHWQNDDPETGIPEIWE